MSIHVFDTVPRWQPSRVGCPRATSAWSAQAAARDRESASAGERPGRQVLLLTGAGLMAAVALRLIVELSEGFDVIAAPINDTPAAAADMPFAEATVESAVAWLIPEPSIEPIWSACRSAGSSPRRSPSGIRSVSARSCCAPPRRAARVHVAPEAAIDAFVRHLDDLPAEESLWAAVPYLYTATTRREHAPQIGEDIAQRLKRSCGLRHHSPSVHDRACPRCLRSTRSDRGTDAGDPR